MSESPSSDNDRGLAAIRTAAALVAVVVILFGLAFIHAYRQSSPPPAGMVVSQPPPESITENAGHTAQAPATSELVVHVVGAVKSPGVVRLPPGKRVIDAIEAAGGPLPEADTQAINMAALAVDGDQIVVPVREAAPAPEETRPASPPKASPSGRSHSRLTPSDGTININTADGDELERLPGVGPAIAARILAYRKEIGRFTSVDQLLEVPGIGEKRLAQIKPFVRIR